MECPLRAKSRLILVSNVRTAKAIGLTVPPSRSASTTPVQLKNQGTHARSVNIGYHRLLTHRSFFLPAMDGAVTCRCGRMLPGRVAGCLGALRRQHHSAA